MWAWSLRTTSGECHPPGAASSRWASAGFAGTFLAHAAVIGLFVLLGREPEVLGTVYAVKLIAAPADPPEVKHAAPEAIPAAAGAAAAPIKPPTKAAEDRSGAGQDRAAAQDGGAGQGHRVDREA